MNYFVALKQDEIRVPYKKKWDAMRDAFYPPDRSREGRPKKGEIAILSKLASGALQERD